MIKYNVLTFHTEGFPFDSGEDLRESAKIFADLVSPYADNYYSYCPRTIILEDSGFSDLCCDYTDLVESYKQNNPNLKIFDNPRWTRVGFQRWKPSLIKHVLEKKEINYGDYLLYHDVDIIKYPQYAHSCEKWKWIIDYVLNNLSCDIFMPIEYPLKNDVKSCLLKKYNIDGNNLGVWSGIVALRKTAAAVHFLNEWIKLSSLENTSPFSVDEPDPDFTHHSVDQSTAGILSQIWIRDKLLPSDWPRYKFHERVFCDDYMQVRLN